MECKIQAGADQKARWPRKLGIVVALLVGVYALYRYPLHHQVQTRFDAIRKQGYPVTLAELEKWYETPPAGENAADVLTNAFAHYVSWTNQFLPEPSVETKKRVLEHAEALQRIAFANQPPRRSRRMAVGSAAAPAPGPGDPMKSNWRLSKHELLPVVGEAPIGPRDALPAEMKPLIAEYLADNKAALDLLHQGAAMKRCRYPVRFIQEKSEKDQDLRHLSSVRLGERLLALETMLQVEDGKSAAVEISLLASFGLARSLTAEPLVSSQQTRSVCVGISVLNLERVLNRGWLEDEQLVQLHAALTEAEYPTAMTRVYVGKRCMNIDDIQKFGKPDLHSMDPGPDMGFIFKVIGVNDIMLRKYLDLISDYVEATHQPLPERSKTAVALLKRQEALPESLTKLFLDNSRWELVRDIGCVAYLRIAETAIAIERYRLARGRLPDQLNDLVPANLPAVPVDPFDGKPIRYKPSGKGYVVWSIGNDGKDDGGKEWPRDNAVPSTRYLMAKAVMDEMQGRPSDGVMKPVPAPAPLPKRGTSRRLSTREEDEDTVDITFRVER
ncbi:MAG: hypothetical protein HY360_22810 [Verrucomicrobia bacterium]|nr:hypothetical protein [Verrucomicrobiota bacterium]